MALFAWTDPRPDIYTSRRAWEASWDHDFRRNYEPPDRLPEYGSVSYMIPRERIAVLNTDHCILFMERMAKDLMIAQVTLTKMTGEAWESFEGDWKGASDERRRTCIEEGVFHVMVSAPMLQMEVERRWCPESSVNYLASDGGQAYLDQVMSLTLPLSAVLSEDVTPILPPHPAIDRLGSLSANERSVPGYKAAVRMSTLGRASLLTRVVKNIFLVFVSPSTCVRVDLPLTLSTPSTDDTKRSPSLQQLAP